MPPIKNVALRQTVQANRQTNVSQNFVLVGYLNPKAMPGDVPTPAEAAAAMAAMRQRARFEALLHGAAGSTAAEDGLGQALLELGSPTVAVKYRPSQRGLRPYVNKVIKRKVADAALTWRAAPPAVEFDPVGKSAPPDCIVELADLAESCEARLRDLPLAPKPIARRETDAARYMRKHHAKVRTWEAIRSLFPDTHLRPKRRRSGN